MSAKMTSFWFRTAETILMVLAFMLPLAFFANTYDAATIKTTLFEAGTLGLAFAWLLKGLERGRWELPASARPLALPALALIAWTAARFAAEPYKTAALPSFIRQELCLALYLIALLEFGGAQTSRRLAAWITAAAWLAGLYGLAQRLGFDPVFWKGAFGERVFSTLGRPDAFGFFLALAVPMALTQWNDAERDWFLRWTDVGLMAVLSADLFWTGSPDACAAWLFLSAAAALLIPAFLPSKASLKTAGLAILLALAAALSLAVRKESLAKDWAFRKQAWSATKAMIAEASVAGVGPGAFAVEFPRYRTPGLIALQGSHEAQVEHPGSMILETTAELGLVGAGLWLWLFGALALAAWQARGRFLRQGALGELCYLAGFSSASLGLLAAAQFGLGLQVSVAGWLLWPLAGVLAGLTTLSRRSSVAVLPLPLGEAARQRAYAPALLAFAGLVFFPFRWLASDVEHNLGVYYARQGDWSQAVAHEDRVAPGADAYVAAQYVKGDAYLAANRPEEALKAYGALEGLAPNYGAVHFKRALAYAKLEDWNRAFASHREQEKLDPLFADNFAGMAQAAKRLNDLPSAEKAAQQAVALEPGQPARLEALAEILIKEKRVAQARAVQREIGRLKGQRKPQG